MTVRPRGLAAAALLPLALLGGCRDAVERRAHEIAGLREQATEGILALEAYCEARDSALAAAERGDPGGERWLEETLYAPDPVDDFCEEFRFHSHEEPPDTAPPPPADSVAGSAQHDAQRAGGEREGAAAERRAVA